MDSLDDFKTFSGANLTQLIANQEYTRATNFLVAVLAETNHPRFEDVADPRKADVSN